MPSKIFLRKIHNRFFHRFLGRIFFQEEGGFYKKPTLWKKMIRDVNQFLSEHGYQTPFIFTKQECSDFWKSVDNDSPSEGNRPEAYATKSGQVINFLNDFWSPEVSKEDSIMELGCNCGANLFYLNELGYTHLSGMEINPAAVDQMQRSFPALRQSTEIFMGSMENLLPKMPAKSVDVIFTMGVSMHIHPAHNSLFQEMTRVARKYVCTVEPEISNSNYVFARNYRRVFGKFGGCQLKSVLLNEASFPQLESIRGAVARLFRV